jgi:predicted nucleic acid-binding protein
LNQKIRPKGIPLESAQCHPALEGGVFAAKHAIAYRRTALDFLLAETTTLDFTQQMAIIYRSIVTALGYSRPKILDRMIAATAIAHDLTLITINGADFRDIPGLSLEIWPSPAP